MFDRFLFSSTLICLVFLVSCSIKERKPVIESKGGVVGIVGYGSLISLQSMEETLGHKYRDSIYLVHLDGFKREWTDLTLTNEFTDASKYDFYYVEDRDSIPVDGMISLNLSQEESGRINGVLYFVSKQDLSKFDERESGYQRVDVTKRIVEFNVHNSIVYTYQTMPYRLYKKSISSPKKYVILKEYTDLVYHACDSIGKSFREEFDETTTPYDTLLKIGSIVQKKKTDGSHVHN